MTNIGRLQGPRRHRHRIAGPGRDSTHLRGLLQQRRRGHVGGRRRGLGVVLPAEDAVRVLLPRRSGGARQLAGVRRRELAAVPAQPAQLRRCGREEIRVQLRGHRWLTTGQQDTTSSTNVAHHGRQRVPAPPQREAADDMRTERLEVRARGRGRGRWQHHVGVQPRRRAREEVGRGGAGAGGGVEPGRLLGERVAEGAVGDEAVPPVFLQTDRRGQSATTQCGQAGTTNQQGRNWERTTTTCLENSVPQSHLYSLVPHVLACAFQSDCTA